MDLIKYLANFDGEFNASLGESGGYITFSNSGRRGNVKYFQISLDSLKKTLEDILEKISIFEKNQDYVEKDWRDNGALYFTDEVANAMITVQTKPLFSTLSKIIKWGNEPNLDDVDDTKKMVVTQDALKNTLGKLAETIQQYTPKKLKTQFSYFTLNTRPLQTIFYGAPGTGKSHKVKEVTDTLPKSDVFRTTFHPDSDYSTFVGCYKPKMVKAPIRDSSGHEITSACEDEKKRVAYEYEPQAFLKAYVRAYETEDPVFLVIEEINRGNCAQIFGDMFQLLDRNENGESDYAIKPETAIQEFLNEILKDCDIADEAIKSGEEMRLPANLHIWATMNTSDQSLFPIDSAFKRRWDWKYVPINTRKESWNIKVNGAEYSWSDFLEKINAEIDTVTHSEDKKLGFYFCKAENGVISAERFVSKVLFYIYNDVFKDYGFDKDIFNDTDGKLCFGKFYNDNGGIQEDKVALFLNNLGVGSTGATEEETDIEYDTADAGKAEHKETLVAVTINGERLTADGMTQFDLYLNAIKKIGVDKVGPALEAMKYRRKGSPMATKNKVQSLLKSDGYSYVEADGYYFVKGAQGYTLVRILEDLNKDLNLNIMIEFR